MEFLFQVLTLFAGVLLEKQIVVICPNLVCLLSKLSFVVMNQISVLVFILSPG